MEITTWEDAGDWSSEEALRLSPIIPRLEAIRLAILERAELFSVDCSEIATPIQPFDNLPFVLSNLKNALDKVIPYFPAIIDGIIKEVFFETHTIRTWDRTFQDINILSDARAFQSGSDELTVFHGFSFSNGSMWVESESAVNMKEPEDRHRSCRVIFKKWSLAEFYRTFGNFQANPLQPLIIPVYQLYCYLRELSLPYTTFSLGYDDRVDLQCYTRYISHYVFASEIGYSTPSGTSYVNGANPEGLMMMPQELWPMSEWQVHDNLGIFAKAEHYKTTKIKDDYYSFRATRYYYRTSLRNTSSNDFTALPVQITQETYLEPTENLAHFPELGEAYTWHHDFDFLMEENELKGPFDFGLYNTFPPANQGWSGHKRRSRVSMEFDLLSNNPLEFI